MLHEKEKIDWSRFIQALTDEDKAFNFPVKYPAIDLDKSTKQSFYLTATILAGGMILGALILRGAKKR
jgi:hypothetical protein